MGDPRSLCGRKRRCDCYLWCQRLGQLEAHHSCRLMPDITGTLRPPRLPGAPPSPANGEMYFDTSASTLYWWDGTTWKSASGGSAAPEVYVGPNAPTRNQEVIWVDTDESTPAVTRDIN